MAKDKKNASIDLRQFTSTKAILFTLMLMGKKLLKQCSQTFINKIPSTKMMLTTTKDAVDGQMSEIPSKFSIRISI
nr:hypothetical protein [Lactiplantibacillus plantarum]